MKKIILLLITIYFFLYCLELPKELEIEIENLKSNNITKQVYSVIKIRNLKCDIRESTPYLLEIIDNEKPIFDKTFGKLIPADESKKTILKIGSASLPYIFEKFNDPNITKIKKIKLIELIDEIKDEDGVKNLERYVNDPDIDIKEKIIKILSKYENETSFLINLFKNENDYIKLKIITNFGENKTKNSLDFLYECLKDNNWEIRKYALWSLGEIKENVNVEKIIPLVKDKNDFVRREAAETFGKIKNPLAIPYLITLLDDPNWLVRITAVKSAIEIGDSRFFEPILSMIYDKQIEVRLEAIKALSFFKDKRATIPLISNLNNRYHLLVREYAAYALGEIRDKRAIYPLISLLKNENFELRKIARESLRKITGIDFGYDKEKWYNWAGQNRISSIREN